MEMSGIVVRTLTGEKGRQTGARTVSHKLACEWRRLNPQRHNPMAARSNIRAHFQDRRRRSQCAFQGQGGMAAGCRQGRVRILAVTYGRGSPATVPTRKHLQHHHTPTTTTTTCNAMQARARTRRGKGPTPGAGWGTSRWQSGSSALCRAPSPPCSCRRPGCKRSKSRPHWTPARRRTQARQCKARCRWRLEGRGPSGTTRRGWAAASPCCFFRACPFSLLRRMKICKPHHAVASVNHKKFYSARNPPGAS